MADCPTEDGTPLYKTEKKLPSDSRSLLSPDGPGPLADREQLEQVSHHVNKAYELSESDTSNKLASARVARADSLPGSDAELQELMKDSPFLDFDSPMTPYEWFKFVVMMPMFLFRCFLTVLIMPFVFVVLRVCLLGTTMNEPLVGWRKAFVRSFLKFWAGILLRIGFNIWPRVTGFENVAKAYDCRAMLVFNHVSYTDNIMLGTYFLPCGLAKASVADIPFFGSFAKGCSFLFVERRGSSDAAKTVHASRGSTTELIHLRAADPRFPLFAIAPEGTCKHHNTLLKFSTGAFVGGRPVLPVLLKYHSKHFHQGWGRVQSSFWHFMRGQTQFINHADIEVLPPYMPSAEERADPRLYADNVRRLMAEKLGAQLSPQGIREQQLLKRHGVCVDWTGRHLKMRGTSLQASLLPAPLKRDMEGSRLSRSTPNI